MNFLLIGGLCEVYITVRTPTLTSTGLYRDGVGSQLCMAKRSIQATHFNIGIYLRIYWVTLYYWQSQDRIVCHRHNCFSGLYLEIVYFQHISCSKFVTKGSNEKLALRKLKDTSWLYWYQKFTSPQLTIVILHLSEARHQGTQLCGGVVNCWICIKNYNRAEYIIL